MTQGVRVSINKSFPAHVQAARLWDGSPVPAGLQERLAQDWAQLQQVERQLRERKARAADALDRRTRTGRTIEKLQRVQAIGVTGAWVLATEIFGWREIENRRQLGGLVGLVRAPYQSGDMAHDQGITRAGNHHVRRVMVQLAWGWLRYQTGGRPGPRRLWPSYFRAMSRRCHARSVSGLTMVPISRSTRRRRRFALAANRTR